MQREMLNMICKCMADSKARLSSCIICLLFMPFSSPNPLHCGKACTHVKHLAVIILHWHKFSKARKTTRKSNRAMALHHKDIVFVEEILCFHYLTESFCGSSWKFSNQGGIFSLGMATPSLSCLQTQEDSGWSELMYFYETTWAPS